MRCPAVPPEIVMVNAANLDIGSGLTTGSSEADKVAESGLAVWAKHMNGKYRTAQ
jgi:hypothetical protein